MNTLYFITGNKGKLTEVQDKLKPLNINVIQKNLGYPEIQAETLEEVTHYGIQYLKNKLSEPFVIEDAGLFISALKKFPGVFSKQVYYTIGLDGVLTLMEKQMNRSAEFHSVYALKLPNTSALYFKGICKGTIIKEKKGTGGFGYDPIFVPNGYTKTFAEMTTTEKNMISHRGNALQKLVKFIQKIEEK